MGKGAPGKGHSGCKGLEVGGMGGGEGDGEPLGGSNMAVCDVLIIHYPICPWTLVLQLRKLELRHEGSGHTRRWVVSGLLV